MKTALFAGSFDPVTKGHLDLMKMSSEIFGKVIVAVGINPSKKYTFDMESRINMIRSELTRMCIFNVQVIEMSSGKMASDLAYEHDAVLIKGVRVTADFDYERLMSDVMKLHNRDTYTMILPCSQETSHISSSAAKEVCKLNGTTEDFLTLHVKQELEKIYGQYRIGITGSIACGKSTFIRELEAQFPGKIFNVDLDLVAHNILFERTEPIYLKIRNSLQGDFGMSVWDKSSIAKVIFSNPERRKHLNEAIRPAIYTRIRELLANKKGLIIFNTTLLAEANMLDLVNNTVYVIDVDRKEQLRRLVDRGHSEQNSRERIKSQWSTEEKINFISNKIQVDGFGYLGYMMSSTDIQHNIDSFSSQIDKILGYKL
jgi:pantetheine-phosphate adenylyltransferase